MAYEFEHTVTNKENYVYKYTNYGIDQTDAPHEFHEMHAFSHLGIASHGLTVPSPGHPGGMQLNAFGLMHGSSALGRKSTCMMISKHVLEDAIGNSYGEADEFTPEGLLEALERNDGRAMVVYMDEFTMLLDKMVKNFMAGIKSIILKLYSAKRHKYTRTSKGTGKNKVVDEVEIKEAHLNIIGNVTPMISERLTEMDIQDGFLGRFLIISPKGKPASKRFQNTMNPVIHVDLCEHLTAIAQGCQLCKEWGRANGRDTIEVSQDAMDMHYNFQQHIESLSESSAISNTRFILIQRIPEYAMKAACWISLGEVDPRELAHGPLFVTEEHMRLAIIFAKKWKDYTLKFSESIGDSALERQITKVLNDLELSPTHSRNKSILMRKYRLSKDDCDKIEATLIARQQIFPKSVISDTAKVMKGRTQIDWVLLNGRPSVNPPAQGARLEDTTPTSPEPGEN